MLFPKLIMNPAMVMGVTAVGVIWGAEAYMTGVLRAPYEVVAQAATADASMPAISGPTTSGPAISDAACPITLDLLEDANAMIGLTLMAPCKPNADVLIAHAGMVFSAKTMASGSLFLSLPALKEDAKVVVKFGTGESADSSLAVPSLKGVQRFAVQWPEVDGFAIHAYENGAAFDDAGHIWAQNLATPLPNATVTSGYLTLLGDSTTEMPMLAEVYTYPPRAKTDVIVEAAVTENTCGMDLMGDAISSVGGQVQDTEITLAMPGCDAVGEFVQLSNLAPDMKLAMAN